MFVFVCVYIYLCWDFCLCIKAAPLRRKVVIDCPWLRFCHVSYVWLDFQIEEVRKWKNYLLTKKKDQLDVKQKRAEEKRQKQLQMVVKKAQEEEAKVSLK